MSEQRNSGILLHISSLPSNFGIGDLGPQAYRFADLLAKNDQYFWQILPLNPTDLAYGSSPYHAYSTFAGNPLLISPRLLYQEGLLTKNDLEEAVLPPGNRVDFTRVNHLKKQLLEKACFDACHLSNLQQEFDLFCQLHTCWLDNYALFEVLRNCYPDKNWNHWPQELKNRDREILSSVQKKWANEIKKEKWIQFFFLKQWNQLKDYCHEKNIHIIGDMPIYVTYHSADVWANPQLFKLNKNKDPLFKAGVPPDYFSKTGQLWGNPVYRWPAHRKEKFHWWIDRISQQLSMVDLLRIDHFRGLVGYWEIPAKEKTAVNGYWVKTGGESFFNMLAHEFPDLPFIAEDLGVITDDVIRIMDQLGLPGMRVLQFGFDETFPHNIHLPHNHKKNCVVYTGTHDNNTIQGWLKKEIKPSEKKRVEKYMGKNISISAYHREFIRMAQASVANLSVIPVQDILGLGEEARMNYPSHADSNWQWRLGIKQMRELADSGFPGLKELTQAYGREKIPNYEQLASQKRVNIAIMKGNML